TVSSVDLDITAVDPYGLSQTRTFHIEVANSVGGLGTILLSNNTVREASPGAAVGFLSLDAPGTGGTPTLSESDRRFEVANGVVLKLKAGQKVDISQGATIKLTISASTPIGQFRSQDFTIQVLPAANFDKLGAYRPSDGSWSLDSNGNG